MRLFCLVLLPIALTACTMSEPKPPVVDYQSKNRITFLYDPLDYSVLAPPEILDMAEEYCRSIGKVSLDRGTRNTRSWSGTEQYYDFECLKPSTGSGRVNSTSLQSELAAQQNTLMLKRLILRNQPTPSP